MPELLHPEDRISSISPVRTNNLTSAELQRYFINTWELYEYLFTSIRDEGTLYSNPDPLRHPLIFYYGHTAAFYVNKLMMSGALQSGINPAFEKLFAVGVDPARSEDLEVFNWPGYEEVVAYRRQVYELVLEMIDKLSIDTPIKMDDPVWAILMGIEHDRIHFETSSVLIRQYDSSLLNVPDGWKFAPLGTPVATGRWVEIPGGTVNLGKPKDFPTFGWDNEYGELEQDLKTFLVRDTLVTNSEFLDFVMDGGYANEEFWSEEGRIWKRRHGATHPKFWIQAETEYRYRNMFRETDMPMFWPAEVNGFEAEAYCAWQGYRLMSEAECQLISDREMPDLEEPMDHVPFNLGFKFGSPTPVNFYPPGKNGLHDVFGNVWCWLSDDFYPLPGFEAHPWYEDFSSPFFDRYHGMLRGGSWASTGTSASKFYRLWFRRHFLQHAGFRVALDAPDEE